MEENRARAIGFGLVWFCLVLFCVNAVTEVFEDSTLLVGVLCVCV